MKSVLFVLMIFIGMTFCENLSAKTSSDLIQMSRLVKKTGLKTEVIPGDFLLEATLDETTGILTLNFLSNLNGLLIQVVNTSTQALQYIDEINATPTMPIYININYYVAGTYEISMENSEMIITGYFDIE